MFLLYVKDGVLDKSFTTTTTTTAAATAAATTTTTITNTATKDRIAAQFLHSCSLF